MSERHYVRCLDKIYISEVSDIILSFLREPFMVMERATDSVYEWCIKYPNVVMGNISSYFDVIEIKNFIKTITDNVKGAAILSLKYGSHEIWFYPENNRYVHFIEDGRNTDVTTVRRVMLDMTITEDQKKEIITEFTNWINIVTFSAFRV